LIVKTLPVLPRPTAIWYVTATDTGAGKTVLTTLLARHLHQQGRSIVALKPVCSGGRSDARQLYRAMDATVPLDVINPWHFRAPLAPVLAARQEQRKVTRAQIVRHLRRSARQADWLLVEGAGGLLSPLGEAVDNRDLIVELDAKPLIVAPNQLGVLNHLLLTLEALPAAPRREARVVFMQPAHPGTVERSNPGLLAEQFPAERIHLFPWLGEKFTFDEVAGRPVVRKAIEGIVKFF